MEAGPEQSRPWFGVPGSVAELSEAWEAANGPAEQAVAAIPLARALLAEAGLPPAIELLENAVLGLGDDWPEQAMDLESELGFLALLDASTAALRWRRLDPYARQRGETPSQRRVLAALAVRHQYDGLAPASDVRELALRAFGDGRLLGDAPRDAQHWAAVCGALIACDALEDAEEAIAAAAEHATELGWVEGQLVAGALDATLLRRAGRLADAEAAAIELLEELRDGATGALHSGVAISAIQTLAETLDAQGRPEHARQLLADQGLEGIEPADVRALRMCGLEARLALSAGETATAVELFDRRRQIAEDTGLLEPETPWRVWAADAYGCAGDGETAQLLVREQLELAERWQAPRALGLARLAGAARLVGEERVVALREAVSQLEQAPDRTELAEALIELAEALEQNGRDGAEARGRARDLAASCGADALVARADA